MEQDEARDLELDAERQDRARELGSRRRLLSLLSLGAGAIFLLAVILTGASVALRNVVGSTSDSPIVQVALVTAALGATFTALTFPLTIYNGFLLPRQYGLVVQPWTGWVIDWLKAMALSGAFALALIEVVYYLLAALPGLWWILVGMVILVVSVILTFVLPVLLVPIFYKLTPIEQSALRERLVGMAERVGARVREVYSINLSSKTTAANAALVGIGRTRSVVLGDTLLDRYTDDEIETILAHELGHHVHADIPKLLAFQTVVTFAGLFVVDRLLFALVGAFGLQSTSDVAGMPMLALIFGAYGLVTSPLSNAFSRRVEVAADDYAVEVTGNGESFISAMQRLASQNLAEYEPPRWVEALLYDHPSIGRRVARARKTIEETRATR